LVEGGREGRKGGGSNFEHQAIWRRWPTDQTQSLEWK
jgi:hypothetical protein